MLLFNIFGKIPIKDRNYYYKEMTVWLGILLKLLNTERGMKGLEQLCGKIYGSQQKVMFQLEGKGIWSTDAFSWPYASAFSAFECNHFLCPKFIRGLLQACA